MFCGLAYMFRTTRIVTKSGALGRNPMSLNNNRTPHGVGLLSLFLEMSVVEAHKRVSQV